MKPISSVTVFLCSSSRRLFTRIPPLSFLNYEGEKLVGISHFSTSSPDSSASSSYHSSSRRNSEDVRNVRVSVWWDFENCSVPCNVNVYKVTQCITAAVRAVGIKGPIQITAFGDVLQLSRSNQEALSSTGINLTHIPHGGKNSADRSLLVDLMYWVSQNPPPAHLFLISGDRDFASILHRLRMNNYNILLASKDNAPAVLCSAASIMWQWPALVKGENLSGKHFNQPPDGPYASWYGHYRVPLEDPFAVSNQVPNQTSSLQSDEVSDSNSDPKPGPVPKAVVNVIRNIMNSYPKGLSITELRSELGRSNVTLEKDLYGHKKFSRFLMAMPYLLRLQSGKDGQFVVHGVSPKCRETSTAKDSVPVVAYKEDGGQNPSVPSKEDKASSSSSSKLNVPNLSTDSLPLPEKQEEGQQVEKQSPVIEKSKEGEVSRGQLYPVKMKRHTPEVGIFKSIWRKWFKGNDGNQDKISLTNDECSSSPNSSHTVNADANLKDQYSDLGKLSSLSTNEVIQDAENVDKLSKPHGIFSQIAQWCKFWKNDKNSDNTKAESSKIDKEIPIHSEMHEIFTESFWNDMLAFLETSKSSASILQSKTRQEMTQKLQKFGPSQLQSLTESHVLHLVNLLISEKKWILETPSLTFPFRLITPSKTKPSNSKESDINSQGQERKISVKKVSPKTRSQVLSHCQKLVNEVVKEHPNGFKISSFKKLFLERYDYPLEVQQLGYQKLSTLLQIMPGVKVESNYILPSGDHFRQNRKSEDENDTKWEELGPISGPSSKKDYDFESVSDNDISDSEEENFQKGKTEENSSLLQILDSWYSNREDNLSNKKLCSEDDDVVGVNLEQKQKPSKQYSFVTDKPREEKENLINGILVSLKKQGNNGSSESKIEG